MTKRIIALGVAVMMCFGVFCGCYRVPQSYTATFNANSGEGMMADVYVSRGEFYYTALPKCEFTKEGFESLCWSLDSEGKELLNFRSDSRIQDKIKISGSNKIELFAVWSTIGFEFEEVLVLNPHITAYNGISTEIIVPAFAANGNGSGVLLGIVEPIFKDRTDIESVKNIPDKWITASLFSGCTNLKVVEMRESITRVYQEAFAFCVSIEKLIIPATIEQLGEKVFFGWTEDQTIEFEGHSENVFGNDWLLGCNAKIVWKS